MGFLEPIFRADPWRHPHHVGALVPGAWHDQISEFSARRRCIPPITYAWPAPAGVIELVAGTLITLGLYSRCAAFVASGEMAVAYFLVHIALAAGFLPDAQRRRRRHPVLLHLPLSGRGRPRRLRGQREIGTQTVKLAGDRSLRLTLFSWMHGTTRLTPEILLRAYAEGLFPMAERRDDPAALLGVAGEARHHSAGRLSCAAAPGAHRAQRPLHRHLRPRLRST